MHPGHLKFCYNWRIASTVVRICFPTKTGVLLVVSILVVNGYNGVVPYWIERPGHSSMK